MRALGALLIFAASGAQAQIAPPLAQPAWQPTQRYVTAGQDEPGYRSWYLAAPWRAAAVARFNDYLKTYGVAGIVPTWQLLRTASYWHRCGADPFEVAPVTEWPNIVQTLRYVRDRVIPTIGPVEPVSAYRNPTLNQCAGGASESAHRYNQAIDMVPLWPITREALMRKLCAVHRREGAPYGVGLGFYAYHRFHIDTRKFRNWGFGDAPDGEQCRREAPRPTAPPPSRVPPPMAALPQSQPPVTTVADPLAPKAN